MDHVRFHRVVTVVLIFITFTDFPSTRCEQSAIGNLLIGRENSLSASSTCGSRGPENFCIVSHLAEAKKCFSCNAKSSRLQHGIENIIPEFTPGSHRSSWWQSENGVEKVTIRFDLEAIFLFTHMIIRSQSFRPAAMLIERSDDFGKTWKVYRYFAHNCQQSFPGVSTDVPQTPRDVVCESRYSGLEPSTGGEVIFKVLPSSSQITNPYSKEVYDLLRVTNLRINLTKLHTLGDDLLDDRDEIREKYYYAIKEMVVSGICSCNGHASRCVPMPGVSSKRGNMVHGSCECVHNTKGRNCEVCEDFHNDLPWQPALRKNANMCKRCNCNGHSTTCHFDEAVYRRSNRVSGGVCDDCRHNTQGQSCDRCKPFYYHDESKTISDPEACRSCKCDPVGSLHDGLCDPRTDPSTGDVAGHCHCKANVEGHLCDRCKNGFWNLDRSNPDGCEACTCDALGAIDPRICNAASGECSCKIYTTARDCGQCLPEFWGLSKHRDGCKPCDCDLGGAFDNFCDVVTGQCSCRHRVTGRTCSEPDQKFYTGSLDFLLYEGELTRASDDCQVVIREPYRNGKNSSWTGTGFMRAFRHSSLNFTIDDVRKSLEYDVLLRYESDPPEMRADVQVLIERDGSVDEDGPCADWKPGDDRLQLQLPRNSRSVAAVPSVCLEAGKRYTVQLRFTRFNDLVGRPSASVLVDSVVLMPSISSVSFFGGTTLDRIRRREYEKHRCSEVFKNVGSYRGRANEVCARYDNSIGFEVFDGAHPCGCDPTGSDSLLCSPYGGQCPCKKDVAGRRCDRCKPGTYGMSPQGCWPCDCDSIGSLDNFCNLKTGSCKCRPNAYGRTCSQCEPGFWNFPHCERCDCNGNADSCDSKTGACYDCQDFTAGHNCDYCIDTFYGDPRIGVDIPCRPCPCPGPPDSGRFYAHTCSLDPETQDVICDCLEGHTDAKCGTCDENYFGEPNVPYGGCKPCECNGNTDLALDGNCDRKTGSCLQCLYNTSGSNCQLCKPGFHGDALERSCEDCQCDLLGTDGDADPCDHRTGQCSCLPHVVGKRCDACEENHWRIASGTGCDPCDCDGVGSVSDECNEYDGSCECKQGFGGRRCDQCQVNYWGNPNVDCRPCRCDLNGSATEQCDRESGRCFCQKGATGEKCDECERGFISFEPACSLCDCHRDFPDGQLCNRGNGVCVCLEGIKGEENCDTCDHNAVRFYSPPCKPCGECFDNWNSTLKSLRRRTDLLVNETPIGGKGRYSQEFEELKKMLKELDGFGFGTRIATRDLDELRRIATRLGTRMRTSSRALDIRINLEGNRLQRVREGKFALNKMRNRIYWVHQATINLRLNATRLQEPNVQGALNETREMAERSEQAERLAEEAGRILTDAARYEKNTQSFLSKNSAFYKDSHEKNWESHRRVVQHWFTINAFISDANQRMCGGRSDGSCSDLCGGIGCGFCGGLSCDDGAVNKATMALVLAKTQSANIHSRKHEAEQWLRSVTKLEQDTTAAKSRAKDALDSARYSRAKFDHLAKDLSRLTETIRTTMNRDQTNPFIVRNLAERVLRQEIQPRPEEISHLARRIKQVARFVKDSKDLLANAAGDMKSVNELKTLADRARNEAIAEEKLAGKVASVLAEVEPIRGKARRIIERVEQDMKLSEEYLADAMEEVEAARLKGRDTSMKAEALEGRLKRLRTQFVRNDFDLHQGIGSEAEKVVKAAELLYSGTRRLNWEYSRAKGSLTSQVFGRGDTIQRARGLLNRATELTSEATRKYEELIGVEKSLGLEENEKKLENMKTVVDRLTHEMEQHLAEMEIKSRFYGCPEYRKL